MQKQFRSRKRHSNKCRVGCSSNQRTCQIDPHLPVKEKRWVLFKGDEDPTTVPVEWISWLNGQRKKAPTPEEMNDIEARRERVRLNVARPALVTTKDAGDEPKDAGLKDD